MLLTSHALPAQPWVEWKELGGDADALKARLIIADLYLIFFHCLSHGFFPAVHRCPLGVMAG